MKFVFENESKTRFANCTGDEMKAIVCGLPLGLVELFSGIWQEKHHLDPVFPAGIYRVKKIPLKLNLGK